MDLVTYRASVAGCHARIVAPLRATIRAWFAEALDADARDLTRARLIADAERAPTPYLADLLGHDLARTERLVARAELAERLAALADGGALLSSALEILGYSLPGAGDCPAGEHAGDTVTYPCVYDPDRLGSLWIALQSHEAWSSARGRAVTSDRRWSPRLGGRRLLAA